MVIGAGLAGCNLCWSLDQCGFAVNLIDAGQGPATGASSNTRAVFKPQVNRNHPGINAFYEKAFTRTLERLSRLTAEGHPVEHQLHGVLQLIDDPHGWPKLTTATPVDRHQASDLAALSLSSAALHFPDGGWIDAGSYCQALLADCKQLTTHFGTEVIAIESDQQTWNLECATTVQPKGTQSGSTATKEKRHSMDGTCLVLACGPDSNDIATALLKELNVSLSRNAGQTTRCQYGQTASHPNMTITGKRYIVPDSASCTVGATHRRSCIDLELSADDNLENLKLLDSIDPALSDSLLVHSAWRAVRASTPDRLPLVGQMPDPDFYRRAYSALKHGPEHQHWEPAEYLSGLYLLTGLGSRGVVSAALCSDLLCELMTGADRGLHDDTGTHQLNDYCSLLHPARFLIRSLKRGKS